MSDRLQNQPTGTWVNFRQDGTRTGSELYHLREDCGMPSWFTRDFTRKNLEVMYPDMDIEELRRLMKLDLCLKCKEWLNRPTPERVIHHVANELNWSTVSEDDLGWKITELDITQFLDRIAEYGYKIVPMTKRERKEARLDW